MGSLVERETLLKGQVEIWQMMLGFVDLMALKAAVELSIADILSSFVHPVSLSQIASGINSSTVDMDYLARLMRYLARKHIFKSHHPTRDDGETKYSLNENSKWLLKGSDLTLSPMVMIEGHPWQMNSWQFLGQSVKEGGTPFKKANGCEVWDFAAKNSEFNEIFNDALGCTAKIVMKAVLGVNCFDGLTSLVDVGGGTGGNLAEILKVNPHVKGVNFDLPHVVSTAPAFEGIQHVGGDMFGVIPSADAVFMKWILHNWGDESCVKILRNCRKAIPKKTGKIILVEIVIDEDGISNALGDIGMVFDMLMLAHTTGGKERTELQWKKLLQDAGFPSYKIFKISALHSVIEAYPY